MARLDDLADRVLRSASERAGEIEVWADDVPDTWRGAADERGVVPRRYEPCASAPWITKLEGELGLDLPPSVRALYLRYRFLPFDLGGLSLMANTGEHTRIELTNYVHSDPMLCPYLLGRGLVPFARPATGAYDPVCLDTRSRAARREYPLVSLTTRPSSRAPGSRSFASGRLHSRLFSRQRSDDSPTRLQQGRA